MEELWANWWLRVGALAGQGCHQPMSFVSPHDGSALGLCSCLQALGERRSGKSCAHWTALTGHSLFPGRDLKVSNLLMTDKGCVKIGETPAAARPGCRCGCARSSPSTP